MRVYNTRTNTRVRVFCAEGLHFSAFRLYYVFPFLDTNSTYKNEHHPCAFEIPPPKYSAEYILKLPLDRNTDQSRVCRVWPVSGVKSNATFVVDITSLKHPDDVRKDFSESGSTHPFAFKATFEENGEVYVEKCAPGASSNIYLRRLHCYHLSNTNFRRLLAFVSGMFLSYGVCHRYVSVTCN